MTNARGQPASGLRYRLRRAREALRRRRGTPPPEVVVEPTHVGPRMDDLVARMRRNQREVGVDPDYDLVREHFDHLTFMLQAGRLHERPRVDPIAVLLDRGAEELCSPDINFSMESYLRRHPERADDGERSPYVAWLRRGRAAGEVADPAPGLEKMAEVLGTEPRVLAEQLGKTRSDLQKRLRTGTLGQMFAEAAELEPLIGSVWRETTLPRLPPLVTAEVVDQVSALYRCQQAAGFTRARVVLVLNQPRWGGARRAEGHICHALASQIDPREIVVIHTDVSGTSPAGRYPSGVREIDFAAEAATLSAPAAQRALVELIRSFGADSVVGINSRLLADALIPYGAALAASERIFLMLFCLDQTATGALVGFPARFFYRCFDLVEGVITDSHHLASWLRRTYRLGAAAGRVHVLSSPVDTGIAVVEPPRGVLARRPQVFWAGRWDRQKRIGRVLEIARLMPDVDLRIWGEPVLGSGLPSEPSPNVRLEGTYDDIAELPLLDADVWLYTSAWDGVPSQLLEIGMTGIPIVGSLVGGTGEVLAPGETWPVTDVENPAAYEQAIREVLAAPLEARSRARALRDRLSGERTEEAYAKQVTALFLAGEA